MEVRLAPAGVGSRFLALLVDGLIALSLSAFLGRLLTPLLPAGFGYAVFGKVVSGMEVVDKIRTVPTANKGMFQNVPVEPVIIKRATLEK